MIKIVNITKSYKQKKRETFALNNISFNIRNSEFVALFGASGSGKTTLLNLMGLLDRPDQGKIFLDEIDITELKGEQLTRTRREKIGLVFQFFNLIPTLSSLENVELPMRFSGIEKATRKKRALELLENFGLSERKDNRPSELSGGEQQRVAIARALVNNPRYILADEPTGNLDEKNAQIILKYLLDLQKERKLILIVATHDTKIRGVADRVITLNKGELVEA